MAIAYGSFSGDDSPNVDYVFHYQDNGLFEYEIENGDQDKIGTENVLGSQFLKEPIGYCTWTELPKMVREDFAIKLTLEQLLKTQLVAKTVFCEGTIIISSDKANWEELEFKAKLMIKERRGEL